MRVSVFTALLLGVSIAAYTQVKEVHLTAAIGNAQGTVSLLAGYDREVGSKEKFAVGFGARFTSYFGTNQYYQTAPAKLTTGSTGPLVIFKENIPENIDTVLLAKAQVNSLNLFINMRYAVHSKFQLGFNIDAIGFSFGASQPGTFRNTPIRTRPASFNALLISDNDRGNLNSELYLKYLLSEKWSVKVAAQFHFTEYFTETEVQQFPEPNDRFRNKALMGAIGVVKRW
ncbi:MAG: hypothetical protein HRU69_01620 [Flammeovirgaceae bacterium]|nr:MAG: hypothetical protein HRU69_01620 [Flammeovirgaceae bacterium]